jgi:hypothetical protein
MRRLTRRLFWSTVTTIILVLLLFVVWKYALGSWTFKELLTFLGESLKVLIPSFLIILFIYKTWLERLLLYLGRIKSAKVIADDIAKSAQVDGKKRSGKDSSQSGAAIILKEELKKRYKKELKTLREKLYLYDFKRLNKYLDNNFTDFFVASKKKFGAVFQKLLKEHNCFIDQHWLSKGINPTTHYNTFKFRTGKRTPDVPFKDGITPGGKHMLSMLRRYVLVYIRLNFIPNYIMSNQPIIENVTVTKSGIIKTLFSKIFKVDYISLKEPTPIPFTIGMIVLETETAMFYSNTDKKLEEFIKNKSGIREFMTILGHLLEEESYFRGITQDKNRPNKSLRELYEGFMHMFKFEFASTRNFFRLNYKIRRLIIRIRRISVFIKSKIAITKFRKKFLCRKTYYLNKRLSILHQKDLKVWAKGYIIYYIGIYEKIEDSGKKVKYPLLWGTRESKTSNSTYTMSGFKQINKITDCFGRYNTHMMNTVREAKEQIYDMHFTEVPCWTGLDMSIEQMENMNYPTLHDMNMVQNEFNAEMKKKQNKLRRKNLQRQQTPKVPNLKHLEIEELLNLCNDYSIEPQQFDKASSTYEKDIIVALSTAYRTHNEKPKKKKEGKQL